MPGLFKPTFKNREGKQVKTAKWYGYFTTPDGKRIRRPLSTDKSVAQRMLAEILKSVELERLGERDRYAEHRRAPLSSHLDAWEASLLAKARPTHNSQTQAKQTARRARIVFDACKFETTGDIQASAVASFIAALRQDAPATHNRRKRRQLSLRTCNTYLIACKQFCRWMVRERRMIDSPLIHLQRYNVKTDRRHDRRALTIEEVQWLLKTTKASKVEYRDLTGLDRYMLYSLALGTGFRRGELASLKPDAFRLNQTPAVVRLEAQFAKNQQEADQPIRDDLAALFRDYLRGRRSAEHVWLGGDCQTGWAERAATMFARDREAARTAWIKEAKKNKAECERRLESTFLARQDSAGLFADFHALRHTFITMLARSGVTPKVAQLLARHSDINLTMNFYTHLGLFDKSAALESLPSLAGADKPALGERAG